MLERVITVILACLLLVLTGPAHADRFIAFSDLHFDPTADPSLVEKLLATDVSGWTEILDSVPADYGAFGRDATWPLVRSALDQMRLVEPTPAFLILTGDLLAHRLRTKFTAAMPAADGNRYDLFVVKTAEFLAREIMRRFPGKPVFLALGNNDSICGDYMLAPDGGFLGRHAEAGAPDARDRAERRLRPWLGCRARLRCRQRHDPTPAHDLSQLDLLLAAL